MTELALRSRVLAALDLRRYEQAAGDATKLIAAAGPTAESFSLLARGQIGMGKYAEAEAQQLRDGNGLVVVGPIADAKKP